MAVLRLAVLSCLLHLGYAGICENEECEEVKLLQRKRKDNRIKTDGKVPQGLHALDGKSVYLLMPDRFARSGAAAANTSSCSGNGWCNGTLKGITEHLDYIKGMGFDCIWVTPVVLNLYGPDGQSGYGYHGYWAQDWTRIDPNFGTAEEMKELVEKTHEKGMCFILDIVLNHVRPLHSLDDLAMVKPFNETKYFHLLNISNMTFNEYTVKMKDWPYPTQSIGPGAQCYLDFFPNGTPDGKNNGTYCNNYPGNNYSQENYYGNRAHGPPELKYCSVGNYDCKGYNKEVSEKGWFYDLGDLNQSVAFVRENLKKYVMWLVDDFHIDGFRLDTTPYMPHWWLKEVQDMLYELDNPLHILGEVTASNISFHASYQLQADHSVLGGMENFPLVYAAVPGYCGWPNELLSPVAQFNLTYLARFTREQQNSGLYSNTDLLMNMMDNQDEMPIAALSHTLNETGGCQDDVHLILNAWSWLFFAKGMPMLTWGDEQGNTVYRESMWTFHWNTSTWQYHLIKKMNHIRHEYGLHSKSMTIPELLCQEQEKCGSDQFVFYRGPKVSEESVWVFTNNLPQTTAKVTYYVDLPEPPQHYHWHNIFDDEQNWRRDDCGFVETGNTKPLILVLKHGDKQHDKKRHESQQTA